MKAFLTTVNCRRHPRAKETIQQGGPPRGTKISQNRRVEHVLPLRVP